MSSPWVKSSEPVQQVNLADIMSEQYAHKLHDKEVQRHTERVNKPEQQMASIWGAEASSPPAASYSNVAGSSLRNQSDSEEWEDYSALLNDEGIPPADIELPEDSDAVIARLLQSQFDHEYNEELRRIERQQNKQSKVTVTLNKFLRDGDAEFLHDTAEEDYEEDELEQLKHDWDRFEDNERQLESIPRCGFKVNKEGEMITKHDPQLCAVRNAQRVMSFPPEFPTGDAAGFDMKLSNKVRKREPFTKSNLDLNVPYRCSTN